MEKQRHLNKSNLLHEITTKNDPTITSRTVTKVTEQPSNARIVWLISQMPVMTVHL